MKDDTPGSVKFCSLKTLLGLRYWQVVGILESLRIVGRKYSPDGGIGKYSSEEISAIIEWGGDAADLVDALVLSGWLIPVADERRLVIEPISSHEDKRPCRRWIPRIIRLLVLLRDGRKCRYCGEKATALDHLVPYSRGGGDIEENLVACCKPCNSKKRNRTPEEAGMILAPTHATILLTTDG